MHAATTLACVVALLLAVTAPVRAEVHDSERLDADRIVSLTVFPAEVRLVGRDSRQQVLASVDTGPGRSGDEPNWRDATRLASYLTRDPDVAAVSSEGVIHPVGTGATEVEVTIGSHQALVAVTVEQGDDYLPIDFRRDIVPILTKAGCNGGGCHGKTEGRGGFELSLFGFDPHGDHNNIVRASRGRRLFPGSPDRSLLLLKPAGVLPHGGGVRLNEGDDEYERLMRWIAEGAAWGDAETAQLERIEVEPTTRTLEHFSRQQIVVTAIYSDGSRRDVTRTTEFRSNETSVAEIDQQGLVTTLDRTGESAIVAQHQGHVGVCRITVPWLADAVADASAAGPSSLPADWRSSFPEANFIDAHVNGKLRQLGVPPSELADDYTFLRRATLQITGALPKLEEIEQFVGDRREDKRGRLIDRLLDSGGYADHFAQKWADILRNKRRGQKDRVDGTIGFHRWLRNAVARNMPYDQFVEEIITASGDPAANPKVQWYHELRDLDQYVDDTAQVFLGVRIGCARCHHHPFEKFSQEDWYGLAAFFARVDRKGGTGVAERRANETIFVKPTGDVRHPLTGEVVPPHGLGADPVEIPAYEDPRRYLVDWMRGEDNPYFARALVNRLWAHFFSRGLVEPHDDLRVTNPATNEPLLDALADEFVRSGFDVRHVVRLICTSTTYQLSAEANEYNLAETQAHARFYPQRLKAEAMLDAIDQVTGSRTSYSGLPAGTTAVQLPDEGYSNAFLTLFGRPPRESACECEREAQPNLAQSLFLMNDGFVQNKLKAGVALPARLAKDDARPHRERVEELFLTALCRPPSAGERQEAVAYLESESDSAAGYRNLLWALLNTKEFLFVH